MSNADLFKPFDTPQKLQTNWFLAATTAEKDILAMVVFNGKIYASTGQNGKLLRWDGIATWTEVAPKLGSETDILSLAVFNNKIYGGTGQAGKLYEWNGSSAWVEVAPQLAETQIHSLLVYNGKLYGGTGLNGKLYEWNGSSAWVEVAPKLGIQTVIFSLVEFNGKLYGGTYPSAHLYEWNGTNAWIDRASSYTGGELEILSLLVYKDELYGGSGNNGQLLKWNLTDDWIVKAPNHNETDINALAIYNDEIYAATTPNGRLVKWNGVDAWENITGEYESQATVSSLVVLNDIIYGGTITGAYLLYWSFNVLSDEQYLMVARHMPTGKFWEGCFNREKNLGKLIAGLAVEYYRLSVLIKEVEMEMDINQTNKLIEEWELSVGIPNDCFNKNTDIVTRRLQIGEMLSNFGGVQTAEDFVRVAAVFGYNVTVTPASIAYSTPILFPLLFPMGFFTSAKAAKHTIVVGYPDGGQTGQTFPLPFPLPFEAETTAFLRCIFELLAPANVDVIFDFS